MIKEHIIVSGTEEFFLGKLKNRIESGWKPIYDTFKVIDKIGNNTHFHILLKRDEDA